MERKNTKSSKKFKNPKKLLKNNPHISKLDIERWEELDATLEKLGITTPPYGIRSPYDIPLKDSQSDDRRHMDNFNYSLL